ncbi:class I SAM-dependent methyltransferase [Morganella morganii]|uniref:class I SAM-dependent methyltransferase n=1 Tax=Morganella morganii TaxID=582 RepID=UPI00092227B1|nr:class I SAM-dependent methyltransferase [Morganella morganii]SGD85566.1 Methyltransferase domain [Mycobacterium tuberculosis]MBA5838570.1 class I SAM-dependent methyltransferase [Morganella morganii]MBC4001038.1 class I SAM-dependent methyltransferase [Morganella morganii]HCR4040436.1 class I SAM-dependent methyltransferase [Morganella morganii]HCR4154895.1 class I SAM-dependent methyltransferase [Morganella morganii]
MKPILDMCCGSRMFYFDKENPNVLFCDIRRERHILCDGRELDINPDVIADFRNLPFPDKSFEMVIFDPPHLVRAGENGWQRKKYGALDKESWRDDLSKGFGEAMRVLKPNGILIFKWNETQIKTSEVLALTDYKPVFGHPSGKRSNTHWVTFMKEAA